VTIVAVRASSSIRRHSAFFDVMFACTFEAALFVFAESSYMIKIEASIALCDTTVSLKQLI